MLRVKNLSNALQKRTIRPHYAQTQATPYAAELHSAIGSGANFTLPTNAADTPFVRTADAASLKGGLVPGTVMVRVTGDQVAVGTGANPATGNNKEQPFGLLANFVGGDLDELGTENKVGVWRGPDSVFELLAPAFNPAITSSVNLAANDGAPVPLVCGEDGLLTIPSDLETADDLVVVAHLIDVPSTARIIIDLKI
jgi:hypothetical protein